MPHGEPLATPTRGSAGCPPSAEMVPPKTLPLIRQRAEANLDSKLRENQPEHN